jgi:membrane complex biogenesis BtpA family protein
MAAASAGLYRRRGMGKPFLGVVHLKPLPSARGHPGMEAVLKAALADAKALRDGGADGAIVENFGDRPFHRGDEDDPVPPDVPAALAVVAHAIRTGTGLEVGINCLRSDAVAALGAATAAGARWIRVNVWTGAYLTDQGLIQGQAARAAAYRQRLGSEVQVLADHLVKHAAPLVPLDAGDAAADLAERSGADGLILTGTRTGTPVDVALLDTVRAAVGCFPVWIGSGLTAENAAELWPRCDGAIVGTSIKRGGKTAAAVDEARVAALRAILDRSG